MSGTRFPGQASRARCAALACAALTVAVGRLAAQQPPATLTLDEAIALARRSNPEFLAIRNDEVDADWAVREAMGQLLLPGAAATLAFQYQASGTPRFGILTGSDIGLAQIPAYFSSSYVLGLSYRLSGATVLRPGAERSNRRAAEARTEAADFRLVADVTRQYLAALRARDAVALARQELARAAEHLKLAEARVAVGAALALERTQAEIERGRAEVALLQAEADYRTQRLALLERIGVELERDVELTSTFEVFEPSWSAEELVAQALAAHPELRAARAAEAAAAASLRIARSEYLPSLDVTAGWSGFTREAGDPDYLLAQAEAQARAQLRQCEAANEILARLSPPLPPADCAGRYTLTPEQRAEILRQNDVFPFRFRREPAVVQFRVALPVFTGFARERRVEQARVAAEDARHRRRALELRLRREVQAAALALAAAYRTVRLEERNRALAAEQLRLAQERYRVGAASFLELSDAETIRARADRAHLAAVYAFHEALAALEAAVGRRLRPAAGGTEPPGGRVP